MFLSLETRQLRPREVTAGLHTQQVALLGFTHRESDPTLCTLTCPLVNVNFINADHHATQTWA